MNTYIADRIARDHLDTLLADAASSRRIRDAHHVDRARRAATAARAASVASAGTARPASHRLGRPFAAVHAWIASGQL